MSVEGSRYTHEFVVPFDDGDPAGISFFANAYRYAHRAYEAYLRSIGLAELFAHPEYICPFVHTECDHLAPIRPGETLTVDVILEKLGGSSVTFSYVIGGGGVVRAKVRMVSVFVDATHFTKIAIPDTFRAALQA
ncbi:MAG: thioesterase family protein [bacterium]